jgi:DHA3 family macrolide efflux protein-like MFS transporter
MATQFSIEEGRKWKVPFFSIWTGQAVSILGSQLVQFALIWYLTETTGSATVLATASLVGMLPHVLLSPIVGALVDRWNRRVIMIVADTVIMMATIALAVLFALGDIQLWQIYVVLFVRAVGGGFHGPAMIATTSLMVPKERLTRVQGINQTLNGGLNIISAPLGAILLELLPLQSILALDVITAVLAIAPLFFVHVPQPDRKVVEETGEVKTTSVLQDLLEGLRYVASWPGLLIIGLMAVVINFLLTPAFSLLPILVVHHFNSGALQLGWLHASVGIGIILGGITLGVWGGFKRQIMTTMVGLIGLGVGVIVIGLTPASAFPLALVAIFIVGFMQVLTNAPLLGTIQATVEPEMQGRVFTLMSSVASGMSPIGLAIAGPVADTFGVQTWFILASVACILMGVIGFFIPAVMRFEEGRIVSKPQDSQEISVQSFAD